MRIFCPAKAYLFTTALLWFFTLPSHAQNWALEAADQIPESVHTAMSGGFWTSASDEGFYRVVVIAGGVEHVGHSLFLQWLRTDQATQGYEIIRTLGIKEFAQGHGQLLEIDSRFGDINAFEIDVTANNRDGSTKHFTITVKGDGSYGIRSQ